MTHSFFLTLYLNCFMMYDLFNLSPFHHKHVFHLIKDDKKAYCLNRDRDDLSSMFSNYSSTYLVNFYDLAVNINFLIIISCSWLSNGAFPLNSHKFICTLTGGTTFLSVYSFARYNQLANSISSFTAWP